LQTGCQKFSPVALRGLGGTAVRPRQGGSGAECTLRVRVRLRSGLSGTGPYRKHEAPTLSVTAQDFNDRNRQINLSRLGSAYPCGMIASALIVGLQGNLY
jgi:hypothetical protein